MESYENRIINGVLKANLMATDPSTVQALLARDVEIVAPPERASLDDLWPCIWALAQVLERQFTGRIFLRCGLSAPLLAPSIFSSRIAFTSTPAVGALQIYIGIEPALNKESVLWGDARNAQISFQSLIGKNECANPISGFALAGYLGFAALAVAVQIPPMRETLASNVIELPMVADSLYQHPEDGYTVIGLGQLGQAYLSLLYFLAQRQQVFPRVVLLDKDRFEKANRDTQILLDENEQWEGELKASFLEQFFCNHGWHAKGEFVKIEWNWEKPSDHPRLVLLGLDNFDARRMVLSAHYDWFFESGVGASFLSPKVSWHSISPKNRNSNIFPANVTATSEAKPDTDFEKVLHQASSDRCGWLRYNSITATAPAMGLVASAYVWAEVTQYLAGRQASKVGRARLWSPLLPFMRTDLL